MINIVYFIVACVVFVGIMIYQFFVNKKIDEELDVAYMFLGYYHLKFGDITEEDVLKMTGINIEDLEK